MKYKELIQFEPIETVVQLRSADQRSAAQQLVATYVISDEMADRLTELVIPQLQFAEMTDNKGILIVGNYGTGKSHLMSFISAIAEHADLAENIQNEKVRQAATKIGGQFKVIRSEIGSTTMSLREIIVSELEEYLALIGVNFQFPPVEQVKNHKPIFEKMMTAFAERYPDQGLLLVVDELLDYLRTRTDHLLILDLSFLREIGEVCRDLRFRFVAGIQEALFDNDRFSFVADTLRRVKDRFEQVLIARSDVEFVVAERLLRKTLEQKAKIRAYLLPFARFYGSMNERMDDFVRLFPVHPDYIKTFEQISVIEKREILKTLSVAIKRDLENTVPETYPGLIAYDRYWGSLRENPAFRAVPDIRRVLEVSQSLETRIQQSIKPVYRDNATRIIQALSVQRLTLGDIRKKTGPTALELRDTLCLFDVLAAEMGGEPADDLLTNVETILREIVRIVNGQFITRVEDSGQYYLDVDKDIDHEAIVEKRAESLDKSSLDTAYFNVLARVLERTDSYYPGTHRAWEYELEWRERRASRLGYLFFGTPNQRSTAQPPREFYIYFVQPYDAPAFKDEKKADEVFWRLKKNDERFEKALKRYASASDLATTSSGQDKNTYEKIATDAIKEMGKWLQENLSTHFEITYQGVSRFIPEWIKNAGASNQLTNISQTSQRSNRDLVNSISAICLAPHFEDRARQYPTFSVQITDKNRQQAAQDALRWIRGVTKTQQATAVLDALKLLDGDRLNPLHSPYAKHLLDLLQAKGHGQVLNRNEVFHDEFGIEYLEPTTFRLEPDWVVVLLAALVYSGELVMAITGKKLDASNLDQLVATPFDELVRFKYVELPKDWNTPALKMLFELVGLEPGKAVLVTQSGGKADEIVAQELSPAIGKLIQRLVITHQDMVNGLVFWGTALFSNEERSEYQARMSAAKTFLESAQSYNAPGKLKNFSADLTTIDQHRLALNTLAEVEAIKVLIAELAPLANYCSLAGLALPVGHAWIEKMNILQGETIAQLKSPGKRSAPGFRQQALQALGQLKKEYQTIYTSLHIKARLGLEDDKRKAKLLKDARLEQLRRLTSIDLMHTSQLTDFQNRLAGLKSCFTLNEADLQTNPICSQCGYKPASEFNEISAAQRLHTLDSELDGLVDAWTQTLAENLEDPMTQANLQEVVKPEYRSRIEDFLTGRRLPDPVDTEFIAAVQEALAGLIKITVKMDDLKAALLKGGSPISPTDYRKRLDEHLAELIKGKDANKVRIVLE